jgi:HEAT repeat protein
MSSLRACLALALAGLAAGNGRRDEDLERWVRALDLGHEPEWTQAVEALTARGPSAAERVLSDFHAVGYAARRARAVLLAEIPSPALGARVLELLADPDPVVRRELVRLLGNPALAEVAAAERVRAFERLALEDPNEFVRMQAREALAECGLEAAVPALDRMLDLLPADEAEKAAAGLTQISGGRARLIRRLADAGEGRTDGAALSDGATLPDGVRAALLLGYGRALAEVPGGGEELRERLPFLHARTHPALDVQAAARAALGSFVARAAELSESARADRVLARLGEEGWPAVECFRRRLDLAWLEQGDAESALRLARALERAAGALPSSEAGAWEPVARIFEGAALYALGQGDAAARLFAELGARLDASRARRDDLFPSPRAREASGAGSAPWSEAGGAAQIDRLHLSALVHLWRALIALDSKAGELPVLEELRAAHILFLRSRLVAMRTYAGDPWTLDSLFQRDLSPHTLILFNEKLAPARRGPALDRAVRLAAAFGRVAPLELMGLEGDAPPRRELGDVFFDSERLAILKAMRTTRREDYERRRLELSDSPRFGGDPDALNNQKQILSHLVRELIEAENDERDALTERVNGSVKELDPAKIPTSELRLVYANLLELLTPSMHAWSLAGQLRGENRTTEARELCQRALATLRTAPLGPSSSSELSSARFELLAGSTLMDEGRAPDAEAIYLAAERRLEPSESPG